MSPSRVLVVGPLPPPVHGAARVTALVAHRLRAAGATVLEGDTGAGRPGALAVPRRLGRLARSLLLVLGRRVDAVYVGGAGGGLVWFQALVVLAARLTGRRVAFHHHSFAYLDAPARSMAALTRAGGRRLTHVVLCEGMAAALRSRYPVGGPVLVCSNAGLLEPVRPRTDDGAGTGPLVLGHLSNLSDEKGLGAALETVRRARAAGLDVRLRLAGPASDDGTARRIEAAQAELGVALTYLGRLDGDAVDAFYATLDVFLFPTRYVHEAEPLVVLDAARHSVPSLVHARGCLAGMVVDPAHAVPVGGDFPAAATTELGRLQDPAALRRSAAATHAWFADRRAAADHALAALVVALTGR